MNKTLIPIKNYPGKKSASGTWQQIISQIPKCETFVDTMCGSGLIASMVSGCRVVVNDLSIAVMDRIDFAAENKFNQDYRSIIDIFDCAGSVFYFDPPYLFSSRSGKRRLYEHEWSKQDHINFLSLVKKINQPVLISHFTCPLYDAELKGWRVLRYNSMTRAGLRKESLYMNFPQPTLLQCYKSVGKNFTDRQRIKRKVDRLVSKLGRENPIERAAILSAIVDRFKT